MFITFSLIVAILLLAGCWDVTEPQKMYYVQGVGVDYKDNEFEVYIQLVNFATVTKTEQANPQMSQTEIGKARGKTIEEAIYKLYRSVDQEVYWGHMTYILLSDDAVKNENIIAVFDTFLRFRETRYQIWVYCTEDSIDDIMLVSSILDKSPAATKLNDPQNTWKQESFIKPINLRKLVIELNEPSHEVVIPEVSINNNWKIQNKHTAETSFTGFGILSRDSFKGYIEGKFARGIMWMNGESKQGDITIPLDNTDNQFLTVDIKQLNVDVKPIIKNKQVNFEIFLNFTTILNGFKGKVSQDEVREKVARGIQKDIMTTFKEGLNMDTDIYRFAEFLYRDNVKLWKKLEQDGKIHLEMDSISKISVQINKVSPGRKEIEPITE